MGLLEVDQETHRVSPDALLSLPAAAKLLVRLLAAEVEQLVLDEAGQKLAKSTSATGLRELRAAGVQPFEIRRRVGLGR